MSTRIAAQALAPHGILFLATVLLPCGVNANEVSARGSGLGLSIHGAEETLGAYCSRGSDGRLWFDVPGGARFELITSPLDPAISNPGDGVFHPFDESVVRAAIAAIMLPIDDLNADVFLLPYPRRGGLESAAAPGLILLSPGVRPLSPEHQHAELAHELGHVGQYEWMPDGDSNWDRYRRLRGIEDPVLYAPHSEHANRPHEIFAEDFRALFGGTLANYSGSIENENLRPPSQVEGLAAFMLGISGNVSAISAVGAFPNPTTGPLRFARSGAAMEPLDLFDAAGRRLATLEPRRTGSGVEWASDGRDGSGRPLPPGVVFARVREPGAGSVRVVILSSAR